MHRRSFLAGIFGAVAPHAAEAQRAKKVYRIGWLNNPSPTAARNVDPHTLAAWPYSHNVIA